MESFRTTRWSVVRAARGEDIEVAREALEVLCENYWYPVYAFVRRAGHDADDARDLTQGFFARLIEKRDLDSAEPSRGRFRAYLLTAVKNFVSNERDRERALKRGGGVAPLSIDAPDAEGRYSLEPHDTLTPERLYLRNWALTVLDRTRDRLAAEYAEQGKSELFRALSPILSGVESDAASRKELAERLGMTENALNVAVHRLRRRFGDALRAEIAQTVGDAREVDAELETLYSALS